MLPAGRRRQPAAAGGESGRKGELAGRRRRVSDEHARRLSARHGGRARVGRRHRFGCYHLADRLGVQVLCGSRYISISA